MSSTSLKTTDVALAFKDVSVSSLIPPSPIVRNISGFVQTGCITAVFGASASGKSLFLQALSGRVQNLNISGDVLMDGIPVNPNSIDNGVSYVAQTDMLIGDMTAREMIRTSAEMKLNAPQNIIDRKVDRVLKDFGIDHVADNYIGTIFRAGLSGGQKRRVEIGIEFVVTPSILLLDEPTSGLDGSIAYDVLNAVRKKVLQSNKTLSVALSIHQPNSRILELFDHILVLSDDGGMTFFGTVQESIAHFTHIGFPPPAVYTPTDFYLQVTDSNFSDDNKFDFEGAFASSQRFYELHDLLDLVKYHGLAQKLKQLMVTPPSATELEPDSPQRVGPERSMTEDLVAAAGLKKNTGTSFWKQFTILVKRDLVVASRDPTLYYLQYALTLAFGFMIGAAFFRLKYRIDETQGFIPGGLLWIMLMMVYINVFKVCFISFP
jgi:ABC-type multidrug transport system ATPase subunit